MQLNADFSLRAVVHSDSLAWTPSPMPGVDRRMLDRVGAEVARATSVVRYAASSSFSAHVHDGGEEFLVLDGVFQDEHGDYPAGTYVRNPPTSQHVPRSAEGCTIFVKLWQFAPEDRTPVRIDTNRLPYLPVPGRPGVCHIPLFQDAREDVRLELWAPDSSIDLTVAGGIEVLVLHGAFSSNDETFVKHSWLRLPAGESLQARTGSQGCRLWVKTGHLAEQTLTPPVAR
ncbi:cupin [Pseudomonas taeanensis MS-3]|jgi:hypothetical protein|uniref:Cupin n=1 Tax=Pseudomonas taeanensis MS-3 TaxID=1395571 RepID=A0A0A1YP30_9PSED|nr:cupin domain-containing protein [Pseudomonas taeanensis]KFX70713.1 cupin [Pseudomonas taeanensis MS-3]